MGRAERGGIQSQSSSLSSVPVPMWPFVQRVYSVYIYICGASGRFGRGSRRVRQNGSRVFIEPRAGAGATTFRTEPFSESVLLYAYLRPIGAKGPVDVQGGITPTRFREAPP